MEESWRRKWKVVRKWNVIVWKGIVFLFSVFFFSTMLTACVFVTRDTVRHPRRFVFGKFVRKPNCSWSEAFVNRGLTTHLEFRSEYRVWTQFCCDISVWFPGRCLCVTANYVSDRFLPHLKRISNQEVRIHGVKNQEISWRCLIYDSESHRHVFNACWTNRDVRACSTHTHTHTHTPLGGPLLLKCPLICLKISPRFVLPFLFGFVLFLNIETASYKETRWWWSRQHKQTV